MKILHFCLATFVDDSLYQENELIRQHVLSGHEVLVVASTETHDKEGRLAFCAPTSYLGAEGAKIIRLPYRSWIPHFLARKIRAFPKVNQILDEFNSDIVIFHGGMAWELKTVTNYIMKHPKVRLVIDCHADAVNSAHSLVSREILHKKIYRPILTSAIKLSRNLLCVSESVIDFMQNVYLIPRDLLEFFPLGGRVIEDEAYSVHRKKMRERMGISDNEILIIQTGKINGKKKLESSLRAFTKVNDPNFKFVVAGTLSDEVLMECERLISANPKISFAGWLNSEEMLGLFCAADIYLQPGTQSGSMQMALCNRCAVILDNIPSHDYYTNGTGWLVRNEKDIEELMEKLTHKVVSEAKLAAEHFARENLDYHRLAEKLLH